MESGNTRHNTTLSDDLSGLAGKRKWVILPVRLRDAVHLTQLTRLSQLRDWRHKVRLHLDGATRLFGQRLLRSMVFAWLGGRVYEIGMGRLGLGPE